MVLATFQNSIDSKRMGGGGGGEFVMKKSLPLHWVQQRYRAMNDSSYLELTKSYVTLSIFKKRLFIESKYNKRYIERISVEFKCPPPYIGRSKWMRVSWKRVNYLGIRNIFVFYYALKKLLTHMLSIPSKTQETPLFRVNFKGRFCKI